MLIVLLMAQNSSSPGRARYFRRIVLATVILTQPAHNRIELPELQPTRILFLFGHDANAPGAVVFAGELKRIVRSNLRNPVEFYDELLDLDRFPSPQRAAQLARYIASKYRGFRLDAIVAEGSQSVRFLNGYLQNVFPNVPVVYGLAFEPIVDFSALPPRFTGRHLPLPFAQTFAMARRLQPGAERVVLVGGSSSMDSAVLGTAIRQITPRLGRMKLVVLQDWSYKGLLDSLRVLPPRSFVILSSFRRDHRGAEFNSGDLIASVTDIAAAPVYGVARNWLGDGIVGGALLDFAEDGQHTARLLLQVLRRGANQPLPPRTVSATPEGVDWRQLQRWGLSEKRLLPNTQVLFREPSTWERYQLTILIVLGVMTAEGVLIGLLLAERRRRIRAQRSAEEQAEFETMVAELARSTSRGVTEDLPTTLESALSRIALYARARAAVLTLDRYDGATKSVPERFVWSAQDDATAADQSDPLDDCVKLELRLVSGETCLGALELYRTSAWPAPLVARLAAAAELVAAAVARANEARKLEETREQVAHMARVVTVGELAASVSHELRQPLTAIRAHAEAGALLLGQAPPDVDEARLAFQDIVADDVRAHEVIEHIRILLSKHRPMAMEEVDLNVVCRQAVQLVERNALNGGVAVRLELEPDLALVMGDEVQLQQVVLNLALNGIEAAATATGDREVVIGTVAWATDVELYARDTGPGLTPHVQRHVFESFFSTKSHGLGLGLAIVRTIVERHEGTVRAHNDVDGGAVFSVMLPRIAPSLVHRRPQLSERIIHRVHADQP